MAAGLDQLFRAHWTLVYGYLTRRTRDPVLAEELAQETFYRATRAFLGWRGGSPAAWLLSIARNVLIDEVRRGGRLAPLPESLADSSDRYEESVVGDVLARLPDSHRRVLELVYVHGYSHGETAAMLGTSEGAVKTAVWRARAAFTREFLSETELDSDVSGDETVTARTLGAFLVAMIAIGYLFGSFDGGRDFLIAVLVSAAFATIVELWLRRGEASAETERGFFDERATKRAVRRGVVRTALTAVVWVLLALVGASLLSSFWQTRGDRSEHFGDVVQYGFFAAHPGFRIPMSAFCCNTYFRTIEASFTVEPKAASPLAQPANLTFKLGLRDTLSDETFQNLPKTGLDVARERFGPTGKLSDLPGGVVATALVELRRPMEVAGFYELLDRNQVSNDPNVAVYLQPHMVGGRWFGTYSDERVSWPTPAIAGFQAWVKTLRTSDDDVLDRLGLPPKDELEKVARRPLIYGFVLDQTTPAVLRRLAASPVVRDVSVGDIAFNLAAASS